MSIETNLNTTPYFDDYSEQKDFAKVLFRPGVALQARELTQLQDILQKQIERFGDHIFKSGTVISGTNFQFYDRLNYVKILDEQVDGMPVNPAGYQGLFVKNSSNLIAKVVNYKTGYQSRDPETNYLYLNYLNSSITGNTPFYSNNDVLTVYNQDWRLYDFTITNGGTSISNNDSVQITSALLVKSSNVTTGDITQVVGTNTANATVTEANSIFGTITVNGITYSNNDGYRILRIRPITNDLANSSANSAKWSILPNYSVLQGSNTANVVALIGTGAKATITTDGSGIISDVSLTAVGSGYVVVPHVGIRSSVGAISSVNITALNYAGQVTVASDAYNANSTTPVGTAYAFGVTEGIIYQKGMFLRVEPQTIIVNSYSSNVDNVTVGFISNESIVNSSADASLLDTATGTSNFAAPGAHRLKLTPTLEVINTSNAASNNSFFPLVDFRDGQPYRQFKTTSYSEIAKEFERRTDETNGNFVIDPFLVSSTDKETWSNTYFDVIVEPGLAYIDGVRVGTERATRLNTRRGNDSISYTNQTLSLNYGNFVNVRELAGQFNFKTGDSVDLYDTAKTYITTGTFANSTITPAGNKIGTAKVRSLVFDSGTPGTNTAVYRMYLFDIRVDQGKSFKNNVKSIFYNGTDDGIADIILSDDPASGANVALLRDSTFNSLVFPVDDLAGSKTVYSTNNVSYSYRTSAQSNISTVARISLVLTGGTTRFPYGNNVTLSSVQRRDLIITPIVNATSSNVTTNVTATSSSKTIIATGIGDPFEAGDFIKVYNNSNTAQTMFTQVTSVDDAFTLTVANNWGYGTNTQLYAARHFPANVPIPIEDSRVSANLNNTGTTLTINLSNTAGQLTFSSSANVYVSYNAKVTGAQEVSKSIKRGLLVKLRLANNVATNRGPWCLGIPDVFRLNKVYIGNSSVNTNSTSITQYFYVNNGQQNDYYGHSHLVLKDKKKITLDNNNDWLLVEVDAYGLTSPADAGYFVTDSYTVDFSNATRSALGNSAVNPGEIPDFRDSKGKVYNIIDVVDFRPRTTNTTVLTSTLASANVNPPNTVNLGTHDKLFPQPDSSFTYDFSAFIGRQDRVVIDKNSNITVIEGRADKVNKQPPNTPVGTVSLAILDIPPYPTVPVVPNDNVVALGATKVGGDSGPIYDKQKNYTVKEVGMTLQSIQPKRFTMADIGKLERRIEDLEYYTSLNELEKSVKDINIPSELDPAKNRFKNGFFVDPFNDYAATDISNPELTCEINQAISLLVPPSDKLNLMCRFNYSNTNTLGSLRSEDPLAEPGLNNFGESVLMLPPNGVSAIINQGKFTSAVTGTGGNYVFVGDMSIKPRNLKVELKAELRITQRYASPEPPRRFKIICGELASQGKLDKTLNELDQKFGLIYLKRYPTSYMGYLYFASFIVAVLRNEDTPGFEFIKNKEKQKQIKNKITQLAIKYAGIDDWAQFMGWVMTGGKGYNFTLTGAAVTAWGVLLGYILGLIFNPKAPLNTLRAYIALVVGWSFAPIATICKPIDYCINIFRKFRGKK